MSFEEKVSASHLKRNAYLYIRQSDPRQVVEHEESRRLQYQFRERAPGLGWSADQVKVIDSDQGHSAATPGQVRSLPTG